MLFGKKFPNKYLCALTLSITIIGCNDSNANKTTTKNSDTTVTTVAPATPAPAPESKTNVNNGATFPTGKRVPILCYHQIRDWEATDSKSARVYIVPVANFKDQIKILHDSGYTAILPDQLMGYLQHGEKLPAKPILLTFDDGPVSQYDNALPELERAGYKATFFIMTVSLGRPHYMSREQVKELDSKGNQIACHTWDHHMVTKYQGDDWTKQIEKPKALLEQITGKPIKYFAYPFGIWNTEAVSQLKKYGFIAAFKLSEKKMDNDSLFTIKRIIADGSWNGKQLLNAVKRDF